MTPAPTPTPLPQPLTNHKVIQVAYVVNNLEQAAHKWIQSFGIGPFFVLEKPQITDPTYRGTPNEVSFSTAVAQAGDMHIELVEQHCDSPSCYRDMFAKGEEGFHHVAVIAEDYEAEIARYAAQGREMAFAGISGPMKFSYVDMRPDLPFMIEVLENKAFIVDYFAKVKEAGETWDGSDPIRDAASLF
ncbi:MAG: VOC family protein [Parvibaculales bacterium]